MPFEKKIAAAVKQSEEENAKPKLETWRYVVIGVVSVVFLLFQLYNGMVRPFPTMISNSTHLSLALIVTFLFAPLAKKHKQPWMWVLDVAMMIVAAIVAVYFIKDFERLTYRIMSVDKMLPIDLFCSLGLLVILLESVRRTLGVPLLVFILVFILYAFAGQHLSGPFRYSGMAWQSFAEMLSLSPDGIFGSPLSASVNTLFYFLLFGAFFSTCGGGQVLIDLGMKLSDKTAGGPAKAAVVSSCLMGMISGSAVANVTTTGVFTIPLMKKAGYTPEQAGAIESVSSTGGQIMPPIMGVGAFIMAEMIGISYVKIAVAAIIPALAYYGAEFLLVHFIAKRRQIVNIEGAAMKYVSAPIGPRLYRLIPIVAVVVLVFIGASLTRAALVGTALSIIISAISKETRMGPRQLLDALLDGIKQAAAIAIPTAACGIMIGIVVRSGAANKLTAIISQVGGSNILFALILAMLGCLVLGMALPTVAAYLIANILFCPTIMALGVPVLPANMFIFYFGVIAQITPPVCLASFTAAGIAGANSWKTGWNAFVFAIVAFLVPFVFVFQPSILMQGTPLQILGTTAVMAIGVFFLAGGIGGYMFGVMHSWITRGLLILCAILVIAPEMVTSVVGIAGGCAVAVAYILIGVKNRKAAKPA